jgi:hypothetical protein
MAAIFTLPRSVLLDADGNPISGGKVSFFDAGTTTPRAVYSDAGLTTPISQPVTADSGGKLPLIYMATGGYKIVVADADGVTIYSADDLDSGVPAGSGALAVDVGGTGATTASGARTNLGAAGQSDLDALSSAVSSIQGQITGVGGTLGNLAGLDKITRDYLGAGFGVAVAGDTIVDSIASVVTCSGTIPYDNSIPQISEGSQILSGSFTPVSASSILEIEASCFASMSAAQNAALALFRDTGNDAVAAAWRRYDSANMNNIMLKHRMASWGTTPSTLQIRGGGASGTLYVNGNSSGTQVGGGVLLAYLRVIERLVF